MNISSNDHHLQAFQSERFATKNVEIAVRDGDEIKARVSTNIPLSSIKQKEQTFQTSFRIDLPKGKYSARYVLPTSLESDFSLNSRTINFTVD
jgi:hypothetical protein